MGMGMDSTTIPSTTDANGYGEDDGYGSGSGYDDGDDFDCCPMKYVESWDPKMSGVYVNVGKSQGVPWFCNSQCVYVKEEDYDGSMDMDMTDGYGSGYGNGYGSGYGDKRKSRKTRG